MKGRGRWSLKTSQKSKRQTDRKWRETSVKQTSEPLSFRVSYILGQFVSRHKLRYATAPRSLPRKKEPRASNIRGKTHASVILRITPRFPCTRWPGRGPFLFLLFPVKMIPPQLQREPEEPRRGGGISNVSIAIFFRLNGFKRESDKYKYKSIAK